MKLWVLAGLLVSCAAVLGPLAPPKEALTTSYKKPLGAQVDEKDIPFEKPWDLTYQPRLESGEWVLAPGSYELDLPSFCLHAGKSGSAKGTAYLATKLEGPKAALVQKLIERADQLGGVNQREVQTLIWAVLARAKLDPNHPSMGPSIKILLTEDEVKEINDDRLEVFSGEIVKRMQKALPKEARDALEAENKLREQFSGATTSYEELEATAVPKTGDEGPALGTWTRTPEGWLVRFYPAGYQSTKVQIYVPPRPQAFRRPSAAPAGSPFLLAAPAERAGSGGPWGDGPGAECQLTSLKGMVASPNDAQRQRLLTSPPTAADVKELKNAKSDEEIKGAVGNIAKNCDKQVNQREGYSAANPPPAEDCARMGTLKHECAEEMITQANNPRVKSEVAYDKNTKALPPRGTDAGNKCRGDLYAAKGNEGAGARASADCGGYMCADVVVLKEGKTTPAKSNVKQAYDFKFPCTGDGSISPDQMAKYNRVFGKGKVEPITP